MAASTSRVRHPLPADSQTLHRRWQHVRSKTTAATTPATAALVLSQVAGSPQTGGAESLGRRRGGALTVKAHLLLLCVAAPSSCSFNDSSVAGDDSDDGRCCMGGCRTVCWQY